MFKLKNLFTRALLALMLVTGAGVASAGPIYHVTIDTAGLSGSGVFDFLFSGDAMTAGAATTPPSALRSTMKPWTPTWASKASWRSSNWCRAA
jgi:hypothetical protein